MRVHYFAFYRVLPILCVGNSLRELKWLVTQSLIPKARRLHDYITCVLCIAVLHAWSAVVQSSVNSLSLDFLHYPWANIRSSSVPKSLQLKKNSQGNLESSLKALCDHPYLLWTLLTTARLKSVQISDRIILTLKNDDAFTIEYISHEQEKTDTDTKNNMS